jgi:hypothetical protein
MAAPKRVVKSEEPEVVAPDQEGHVVADAETPAPAAASKNKKFSAVKVCWKGGRSRVYSKELHGEKFWDLAEEFNKKAGGTLEGIE